MSAIVLLSGGMDSTVAWYDTLARFRLLDDGQKAHALIINYGQRHQRELQYAYRTWSLSRHKHYPNQVGECIFVPMADVLPRVGSLLHETEVEQYTPGARFGHLDNSFIPHRNLLFLVIAAMWARKLDAGLIVAGLRGGFSDCTRQFEIEVEDMLRASDPRSPALSVSSPCHISRADTIKLAQELHCLDALAYTLTCFEGVEPPCGKCLPCVKRARGFAAVKIPDPLITRTSAPVEDVFNG